MRLDEGCFAHGALRFTERDVAPAPWPVTRIAASARVTDGWLFATEDGAVFHAARCTGPLTLRAELPMTLLAAYVPQHHMLRGVHSKGALVVIDTDRRAHAVTRAGEMRTLPLEGVLTATFVDPSTMLAVVEPGVLQVSHDGGQHFNEMPVPSGLALRTHFVDETAYVVTTGGVFRYRNLQLETVDPMPDREAWVYAPRQTREGLRSVLQAMPVLPPDADRIVALNDGTLVRTDDDALVTLDARTLQVRDRALLPNTRCRPHSSGDGLRLVCVRPNDSVAVFARAPEQPLGWRILRDSARGEAPGLVAFDTTSARWVVGAPCTGAPRDRVLCIDDGLARRHEVELPFSSHALVMHRGVVLALGESTTVARVEAGRVTTFTLPRRATQARFDEHGLRLFAAEGAPCVLSGTPNGMEFQWRTLHAPAGATTLVHASSGSVLALGNSASSLWSSHRNGSFTRLPSPVLGDASSLALSTAGTSYCVGSWCRLGDTVTLHDGRGPRARAVGRRTALMHGSHDTVQWQPMALRCREVGSEVTSLSRATTHAPGRALAATLNSTRLALRWHDDNGTTAEVRGTLVARAEATFAVRAALFAQSPLAIVERCNAIGCDHALATHEGIYGLSLGRAHPGVALHESAEGMTLARFDESIDGTDITSLVALDARGAERFRRTYVLAEHARDAHVGTYDGHDGLWLPSANGALRFVPIAAQYDTQTATARARIERRLSSCTTHDPVRASISTQGAWLRVMGERWSTLPESWHSAARLEVSDRGVCVRAIEAGVDGEDPAHDALSLRVHATNDGFAGHVWFARRRAAVRCLLTPP